VSILQYEVWRYQVKNKFYPASPEVLLQLGRIIDNRDQQ
jgi:spore coat protein CotF